MKYITESCWFMKRLSRMSKFTKRPKTVITVCKIICKVLCIFLFLFLMKKVMDKFYKATTTTGIKFRNEELLKLPCVTFCPVAAFKQRGLYYEEKSYLENTFRLEDIFHDYTLKQFENKTIFLIKELHTLFLGTCYTLCSSAWHRTSKLGRVCNKMCNSKVQCIKCHCC